MGDNGVVLFISKHLDTEYCFYDEYMTVNGAPIRYSEMVDIEEVTDGEAAFEFTYGGRRLRLPYDPRYREQITPFFVKAALIEPTIPVSPVQEEPEPEEVFEAPEQEEPVQEEVFEESVPEEPEQEEIFEEPVPEEPVQEKFVEEPAPVEQTETVEMPEEAAPSDKPKRTFTKPAWLTKKVLIIAAAVVAALVIGIAVMTVASGKSVQGLDHRVEVEKVETETDSVNIVRIDEDVAVEDYAIGFYDKFMQGSEDNYWVINEKKGTTTMFVPNEQEVVVIEFESVEGETEDLKLLGSGSILNTWIMYPEQDEIIRV